MKRLLMAVLTLGLAAAASVAFATSGAQAAEGPGDSIPGTMEVSPEVVAPGGALTAESISPCYPDGVVEWEVVQLAGGGDVGPLAGSAQADADGHWTVDFAAPDDVGHYRFTASCSQDLDRAYAYSAEFRAQYETGSDPVDPVPDPGPEPDPDPEPEPPAPATPVESEPTFTG